MAMSDLTLLALVCAILAGTVNSDIDGYTERIREALANATAADGGSDSQAPVGIQALKCVGGQFENGGCASIIDKCSSAATSVHTLCPNHIQVVGAMGDSITAAFGAQADNIFSATTEYRGVSWSIGGIEQVDTCATLPNIIKKFNPSVTGYSIGNGDEDNGNAKLNVAVSGAESEHMKGQAEALVQKIKSDSSVDFENDWKMVTLWIGGNNLCRYCNTDKDRSAETYKTQTQNALDVLYAELPRTFVNLVQILDVTKITELTGFTCSLVQWIACDCASGNSRQSVIDASREYQQKIKELVDTERYSGREDFTVVLQPFFVDVDIPRKSDGKPDDSYFAPDCFHFSVKGHREAAVALWNNMLEPVGSKSTNWEIGQAMKCPNPDSPYLYTSKNSQQSFFSQSETGHGGEDEEDRESKGGRNLGLILGTSLAAYVAVAAVMALAVGVWAVKRKRRHSQSSVPSGGNPTDKTRLIDAKTSSV